VEFLGISVEFRDSQSSRYTQDISRRTSQEAHQGWDYLEGKVLSVVCAFNSLLWLRGENHRIIESLSLEKASKITKSNREPSTTMPAKTCPEKSRHWCVCQPVKPLTNIKPKQPASIEKGLRGSYFGDKKSGLDIGQLAAPWLLDGYRGLNHLPEKLWSLVGKVLRMPLWFCLA